MTDQNNNTVNQVTSFDSTKGVVDISDLFTTFWRRKKLVFFVFIFSFLFFLFVIASITPQYTARATIVIKENTGALFSLDANKISQKENLDTSKLQTEIEILKSRPLALEVIKKLNLTADPEFIVEDSDKFQDNPLLKKLESDFLDFSFEGENAESLEPLIFDPKVMDAIDVFLENLKITAIQNSSAVTIRYMSNNPKKSAIIVNMLIKVYDQKRQKEKSKSKLKIKKWLDDRHDNLKAQVRTAESALNDFKRNTKIPDKNFTVLSERSLERLSQDLKTEKQNKIEILAKLKSVRNAQSAWGSDTENFDNHLIRNLRFEESKLKTDLSELSNRYGPKHPRIIEKKSEISSLESMVNAEKKKISKAYQTDLKIVNSKINELTKILEINFQYNLGHDNDSDSLKNLEEELDSAKDTLRKFSDLLKRSVGDIDLEETQIEVISNASIPKTISYPNKMLFTTLAGFVSLFVSLALALILDGFNRSIRSQEDLSAYFNLDFYASIPQLRALKKLPQAANYVLENPTSVITESIRSTLVDLQVKRLKEVKGKAQIMSIVSNTANDGKTLIASWIGVLSARSGDKVLLIDGNLRTPKIHDAFGFNNNKSLIEFLTDECNLEDIIQEDHVSGLNVITTKSVPNNAHDLLNSKKMKKLIEAASQMYDLIVIDTPNISDYSDAKLISQHVENIIYIVNNRKMNKNILIQNIQSFKNILDKDIGFILNRVKS